MGRMSEAWWARLSRARPSALSEANEAASPGVVLGVVTTGTAQARVPIGQARASGSVREVPGHRSSEAD